MKKELLLQKHLGSEGFILAVANTDYTDLYSYKIMINHWSFMLIFKSIRLKDECLKIDTELNNYIKTNFNVVVLFLS